jgi:lysophospholipase L1-like esterase
VVPKELHLRILPLGDSITYGSGSSDDSSYRKDLYYHLTAAGAEVEFIGSQKSGSFPQNNHEGWGGFTIDQISVKADLPQALGGSPNLVLLLIGTNDMMRSPDGASQRLQQLADKITNRVPDAVLLIGRIPPIASTRVGRGNSTLMVNKFNAAIPEIVKALTDLGAKAAFADLSAVQLSDLPDGVHPNDEGYSKMAAGWLAAIKKAESKDWIEDPS